jgi:hypothetical protein
MHSPQDDTTERLIRAALAPDTGARAPEGFPDRVASRVYFAQLLERQRRRVRLAWATGLGGALGMAGIAVLFGKAVDVPAWVVENVPGVLGRLDAAAIRFDAAAIPMLLAATGALASAAVWAGLRWRSRRRPAQA